MTPWPEVYVVRYPVPFIKRIGVTGTPSLLREDGFRLDNMDI